MSRQIVPFAERCTAQIHVLIQPKLLAALDLARGQQNRSEYLRAALEAALAAQGVRP